MLILVSFGSPLRLHIHTYIVITERMKVCRAHKLQEDMYEVQRDGPITCREKNRRWVEQVGV